MWGGAGGGGGGVVGGGGGGGRDVVGQRLDTGGGGVGSDRSRLPLVRILVLDGGEAAARRRGKAVQERQLLEQGGQVGGKPRHPASILRVGVLDFLELQTHHRTKEKAMGAIFQSLGRTIAPGAGLSLVVLILAGLVP